MRTRFAPSGFAVGVPVGLVSALLVTYGVGIVALFASGRLPLSQAGLLLVLPALLALTVLRPEWAILVIVALPPSLIFPLPTSQLIAFTLVALFGFLLQGRIYLEARTGIYPLVAIIALAVVVKADVSAGAMSASDEMLKSIVYYVLLMLVAFHAVIRGRMAIDIFVNALLVGLVAGAILQPFVATISDFQSVTYQPFRGQFGYLAVMGFGVTYVRRSLNRSACRAQFPLDFVLMFAFLGLAAFSFSRTAWMASLTIFALVSVWAGRKAFWIVASLLLVLTLTVPVVGGRVLPGGSADVANPDTLALLTTGRSSLWGQLVARGLEAGPLGQGWGYSWSLSSSDIFGFEGEFVKGGNPFIYAHDDFLFLFVELGCVGLGLLIVFWLDLIRRIRRLSRSESGGYAVRLLVPLVVVMFFVELFDNGFAVEAIAARFYIAAGLIFGLHYLVREGQRSDVVGSAVVEVGRAAFSTDR
jgi:hypothetical protein